MKKIGIIGHFGKGHHLHNGQTVKTQVVYDTLTQIFNEKEIMTKLVELINCKTFKGV